MNGKTKILIAGKEAGLLFAYPAIKWFSEAAEKRSDVYFLVTGEGNSQMTDYGFAKLLHCAYRNFCLIKEVDEEFSFESFVNYVEEKNTEEGSKELGEIMKEYAESSISKKLVESGEKKSQLSKELIAV